MARNVPPLGAEKESLHALLDRHREVVVWKLEGLTDEQLRRPMTPSGTSLLGLVKHLGAVEYAWLCEVFGRPTEPLPFVDGDEDADLRVTPDETTEAVLGFYRRACAEGDAVIIGQSLVDVGTAWVGQEVSLRWVMLHLIEETARHAGHMDILRELIDGRTGDYPQD
jgi:uncharacterized damage-inducible protein DinB